MHKTILLAFLVACTSESLPQLPAVRLVVPGEFHEDYLLGAKAWEELGFDVELGVPGELVECQRGWYHGDFNCQLTIGVVVDPLLKERTGSDAASDRNARAVLLDDTRTEYLIAVAHEVGHIVLDTPRHTHGGVMGGSSSVLRDVDFQLACETIGVCL